MSSKHKIFGRSSWIVLAVAAMAAVPDGAGGLCYDDDTAGAGQLTKCGRLHSTWCGLLHPGGVGQR